jgi:transposase
MDTLDNAITKPVHRLEVFTGAGRRRSFSDEDKARIIAEIVTSGDSVSGVARRHGLSPQQLFSWRRQIRKAHAVLSEAEGLRFVPAVTDGPSSARPVRSQRKASECKAAKKWSNGAVGTSRRRGWYRFGRPNRSIQWRRPSRAGADRSSLRMGTLEGPPQAALLHFSIGCRC